MKPNPDYTRLVKTLWGGQADRVPLLELIVDTEIKSAYLGRPVAILRMGGRVPMAASASCQFSYGAPSAMQYDTTRP